MTRTKLFFAALATALIPALALTAAAAQAQTHTVTVAVSGLHCQGCVDPVEQGLKRVPGVSQARLDYRTGLARVTYDEARVPISKVVNALKSIPHAMGPKMHYGGSLDINLKVTRNGGSLIAARQAVASVPGVQKAQLKGSGLLVTFQPKGRAVTLAHIRTALAKAGITAS